MVVDWSTDSIASAERFAHWREACCQHVYALTPERAEHTPFQGRLRRRVRGALDVADIHCDGHLVQRRPQDIAANPSDTYYVYVQQSGRAWFSQREWQLVAEPGDIVVADPNVPFSTGATQAHFDFRLWRIPRARLAPLLTRGQDTLPMVRLERGDPHNLLIGSWLDTLMQTSEQLAPDALDLAVDTLCGLVAHAAARAEGPALALTAHARRAALLARVKRHMALRAFEPGLCAESVARALAVSPRLLHQLFEPTGSTFHAHLTGLRLARAAVLLRDAASAHLSTADIGFAVGFNDTSTFYRRFKAAHGATPGDYRKG